MFGLFKRKKKCEICSNPNGNNQFIVPVLGGHANRKRLCREHFFQEYKKVFLNHSYKMVVTHPIFDKWNSIYGFYAISEAKKYAYDDQDVELVRRMLDKIPEGKDCAYFDQEASQVATAKNSWMSPSLLPESQVQFLTKQEAWSKVHAGLSAHQDDFKDGFTVPYGEEGVFITSLI